MKKFSQNSFVLTAVLALLLVSADCAEAKAVHVTNIISSYSNSGSQGRDGEDGRDGKDGSDGGTVINGDGSATVEVRTVVNGETIIDYKNHRFGTEVQSISDWEKRAANGLAITDRERAMLVEALERIKLILFNYVYKLK